MKPAVRYLAAGGVLGGIIGVGLGAWRLLTNDIHELKEIEPDALPQAPALGKTGWKGVDKILSKLSTSASANSIPLGLLVGWIGMESGGRLATKPQPGPADTSMGERGFYQLTPEESQSLGLDHERLSTDVDYSLDAGIKLVRRYQSVVNDLGIAPAGSSYYWRAVKLAHSVGSGQIRKIVSAAKSAGQTGSWEQLEQFALGMHILGPQPKKWFPFVDDTRVPREKSSVYRRGLPFGFGIEAPAAIVGSECGFDLLGAEG